MDARVIDDLDELRDLDKHWRQAYAESRSTNPFLAWDYHDAWWRHHGDDSEPRVVVVEDGGTVVGIAPLAWREGSPGTLWQPVVGFPGQDRYADYADVLAVRDHHDVVDAVLDALHARRDWGVLDLAGVPGDSETLGGFAMNAWRGDRRVSITLKDACPWLPLDGDHDAYLEGRSTSLKRNLRKSTRKLEKEHGDVRYEACDGKRLEAASSLTGAPAEVDEDKPRRSEAACSALYGFHQDRQERKEGASVAGSAAGRAFLDDLLGAGHDAWSPEVGGLWAGDHLVATTLNLRAGDRQHGWLMGFDDGVPGASLGRLITHHIVADAWSRGLGAYDMMAGLEPYKFQWATRVRPNWRVVFHRGAATRMTERSVTSAKATARRVANSSGYGARVWRRLSKMRAG